MFHNPEYKLLMEGEENCTGSCPESPTLAGILVTVAIVVEETRADVRRGGIQEGTATC